MIVHLTHHSSNFQEILRCSPHKFLVEKNSIQPGMNLIYFCIVATQHSLIFKVTYFNNVITSLSHCRVFRGCFEVNERHVMLLKLSHWRIVQFCTWSEFTEVSDLNIYTVVIHVFVLQDVLTHEGITWHGSWWILAGNTSSLVLP